MTMILSVQVQELVDSLHRGWNTATVLQSLGCIAQYSVSTFEHHDKEITQYVYKNIFQVTDFCLLCIPRI